MKVRTFENMLILDELTFQYDEQGNLIDSTTASINTSSPQINLHCRTKDDLVAIIRGACAAMDYLDKKEAEIQSEGRQDMTED